MSKLQYYCHTKEIQNIYEKSFPQSERFDFDILKKCNKEPNVNLNCILQNNIPVGMQFTVEIPNNITYLMYFAIDEKYRNQNIGSEALRDLVASKEKVMLLIEKPVNEFQERRKRFYLRNGFYSTGIFIEDADIKYEVLISCKDYKPTVKDLLNRYRFMTKSTWTWNKIKKTFNAEYIKFIEE